jgi:hypothetical protein
MPRKMIFDPAIISTLLGKFLEVVSANTKCLKQPLELGCPGLAFGAARCPSRHSSRGLVSLGFSHQIEAAKTFSERGIANDGTGPLVCWRGSQRQFEDKAGRVFARHGLSDICGVGWLQVKSAFGACALTPGLKAGARRSIRSICA